MQADEDGASNYRVDDSTGPLRVTLPYVRAGETISVQRVGSQQVVVDGFILIEPGDSVTIRRDGGRRL